MFMTKHQKHQYLITGLLAGLILVLGTAGYFIYQTKTLEDSLTSLSNEKKIVVDEKLTIEQQLAEATSTILALRETLDLTQEDLDDLERDYKKEKNKNDDFEDQLDDLSSTLGVLDKLSKTDEELLQKYSKVSFLNEHYIPESTKEIDDDWKYSEDKPNALHSKVMPFFEDMLEEAKDDDIDLWVVSAYRSFEYQAQIKGQYLVTYGTGANTFSADQGFSEHQLGTAVDFTTTGLGGGLTGFQNTEAYEWMLDNAHKYGFTLSYAEDNQYYIFEPWHWRFVGTDLAKDLERKNDTFYDWDQREIDTYLIKVFD
ncbi:MAG: LAS superfamily LD-carboxypeptidase LdcB [Patiriisocius sp.]|jgi:LAS superfamily LD-carboxypeptidase LdcB